MPTHAPRHNSLQHVSPATIYHMTVMPCYDKKLEASRSDFFDPKQQSRDVDCVITTGGFFGGALQLGLLSSLLSMVVGGPQVLGVLGFPECQCLSPVSEGGWRGITRGTC